MSGTACFIPADVTDTAMADPVDGDELTSMAGTETVDGVGAVNGAGTVDGAGTLTNDGPVEIIAEREEPFPGLAAPGTYDPIRALGETRSSLAHLLVVIVAIALLAPWVAFAFHYDPAQVKDLTVIVSGPIVGLLGAVLGFYFGERSGRGR